MWCMFWWWFMKKHKMGWFTCEIAWTQSIVIVDVLALRNHERWTSSGVDLHRQSKCKIKELMLMASETSILESWCSWQQKQVLGLKPYGKETRKHNKSMHSMVMCGMIWTKDFMLDILVCICFLVWDGKHMYSDSQVCISILWDGMYLECKYYMSFPKVRNVMYACMTEIWHWLNWLRCNVLECFCYDTMFGSMRILEFPKGSDDLHAHKTET